MTTLRSRRSPSSLPLLNALMFAIYRAEDQESFTIGELSREFDVDEATAEGWVRTLIEAQFVREIPWPHAECAKPRTRYLCEVKRSGHLSGGDQGHAMKVLQQLAREAELRLARG